MTTVTAPPRTARHRLERATPDHLGAVLDLYGQFQRDVHGHIVSEAEQQACADRLFGALRWASSPLTSRDEEPIWIALVGKKVVGFLWLQCCRQALGPYAGRVVAHAPYLFVRADHRGRRIGHDFMTAAKGFATERRMVLAFDAPPGDVARWERRGFVPRVVTLMSGEAADG